MKEENSYYNDLFKATSNAFVSIEQIAASQLFFSDGNRGNYEQLLNNLNNLQISKGEALIIENAKQIGIGDRSRLYITNDSGEKDINIFNHINVEDSCNGAWQAYLLNSLWHVLPMFWHGCYDKRTYLFSKEDIKNQLSIMMSDIELIKELKKYDIIPKIVKLEDKGIYYISCCYWNDWDGLIKEIVKVTLKENKVIEIITEANITLYKYDSEIIL